MLEKLWRWLLGDKWASSASGIAVGAAINAAAVAANGNIDKQSLIVGAAVGAASAIAGSTGRVAGGKK